jgi:hypothetical protein
VELAVEVIFARVIAEARPYSVTAS